MSETALVMQTESLITSIVHKLVQQYPCIDFDELHGEAMLHLIEAIRTHEPDQSSITTWTTIVVKRALAHKVKFRIWQERLGKQSFPVYPIEPPAKETFNLGSFLSEVSKDAAHVIKIALKQEPTQRALRQILRDLGWTSLRIQRTFTEIKENLR